MFFGLKNLIPVKFAAATFKKLTNSERDKVFANLNYSPRIVAGIFFCYHTENFCGKEIFMTNVGRFKSGGTASAATLKVAEQITRQADHKFSQSPRLNEEAVILWRTS